MTWGASNGFLVGHWDMMKDRDFGFLKRVLLLPKPWDLLCSFIRIGCLLLGTLSDFFF
jgi:hypothetical protein